MDTSVRVGGVLSNVTVVWTRGSACVTCTKAFPARSVASIVNVTSPSVSPVTKGTEHVQFFLSSLVLVTVIRSSETGFAPVANVHPGVLMASFAVNVSVTVSLALASVGTALLDAMLTAVRVGEVVSNVTEL